MARVSAFGMPAPGVKSFSSKVVALFPKRTGDLSSIPSSSPPLPPPRPWRTWWPFPYWCLPFLFQRWSDLSNLPRRRELGGPPLALQLHRHLGDRPQKLPGEVAVLFQHQLLRAVPHGVCGGKAAPAPVGGGCVSRAPTQRARGGGFVTRKESVGWAHLGPSWEPVTGQVDQRDSVGL